MYKTTSVLTSCIYNTTYSRTCPSVSISTVCISCSNWDAPTWFCRSSICPHTYYKYDIRSVTILTVQSMTVLGNNLELADMTITVEVSALRCDTASLGI